MSPCRNRVQRDNQRPQAFYPRSFNGPKCMPDAVTILLVEDEPLDVMALQRGLKKQQVSSPIVVAEDGQQALDRLRGSNGHPKLEGPYIILLDINMPVMTGLEFLHELRSDARLARSVVFVLTSSDHVSDIATAYEKNVAGYILKHNLGEACVNIANLLKSYTQIVEIYSGG